MNENSTPRLNGGQVMAIRSRKEAEERYYANPKICLFCQSIIMVSKTQKVAEVKKKKFCGHSCCVKFYAKTRIRVKKEKIPKIKIQRTPYLIIIGTLTKKEIFETRKNWQSARTDIRKHAAFMIDKSLLVKECKCCKYVVHVEICHIKPVCDFSDNDTLLDINALSNLIYLCPNHHWEFDNGIIDVR